MGFTFGRSRGQHDIGPGTPWFRRMEVPDIAPVPALDDMSLDVATLDGVVLGTNTQRVVQAFTQCPPNPLELRALLALLENPGATDRHLSRICGWVNAGWRAHMLVACHRRQTVLWPDGLPPNVPLGFALTCLIRYEQASLRFWIRDELETFFKGIVGPAETPDLPFQQSAALS